MAVKMVTVNINKKPDLDQTFVRQVENKKIIKGNIVTFDVNTLPKFQNRIIRPIPPIQFRGKNFKKAAKNFAFIGLRPVV